MHFELIFLMLSSFLGVCQTRFNVVPKFYAQDSAIIVDNDQPPPPLAMQPLRSPPRSAVMLPYYQPVQSLPSYKIITQTKQQNGSTTLKSNNMTATAAIFTQEEFPRDLLEIAQKKLELRTLDEVPSISELAELLGTNSAAETIAYIRQLTSTDQGVALMKAYIESGDYTDNINNKENGITTTKTKDTTTSRMIVTPPQDLKQDEQAKELGLWERITAFLNIYNIQPKHKETLEQQLLQKKKSASQQPHRNLRPIGYVRNPLPYNYPIPLRPVSINPKLGSAFKGPSLVPERPAPHLNTLKTLTPAHIQQLARISNIPPKKLETFLQNKPKLAELAIKVIRFPLSNERSALADSQLLAAIKKAMEHDEDLRKLLTSTETLK